jgi:hypothetical protein
LISRFTRSRGVVKAIWTQCSRGKAMYAGTLPNPPLGPRAGTAKIKGTETAHTVQRPVGTAIGDLDGQGLLPAAQGEKIRHRPVQPRQLQQAGDHPCGLAQRQLEQHLDRKEKTGWHSSGKQSPGLFSDPPHRKRSAGVQAVRHAVQARSCPCRPRSAANHDSAATRCSRTSSWCDSGRVTACSCSASNGTDSRSESFAERLLQQYPVEGYVFLY